MSSSLFLTDTCICDTTVILFSRNYGEKLREKIFVAAHIRH